MAIARLVYENLYVREWSTNCTWMDEQCQLRDLIEIQDIWAVAPFYLLISLIAQKINRDLFAAEIGMQCPVL